jgi:hypothetical protein
MVSSDKVAPTSRRRIRIIFLTASTTGAVVFGLYLVAIIALGLIAARYQKTEADFWVAGRRFGLGVA